MRNLNCPSAPGPGMVICDDDLKVIVPGVEL